MNATAACEISPHSWIVGPNGGCCTGLGEPGQLSVWIQNMCNGSWTDAYKHFDLMAEQDWHQFVLPWNWTVRAENASDLPIPDQKCPKTQSYLGVFAAENIVFLFVAVAYFVLKLVWIRYKYTRGSFVKTISDAFRPVKSAISRCFGRDGHGSTNGLFASATWIAILLSAVQLGFNFASAYIIKHNPGYEDVPAPLLALLFCARPRIGWLACGLSLCPDRWLIRHFGLSERDDSLLEGRMSVNSVAIGSALSEIIMQILGSYSLGKTAHVGVDRKFYLIHRLRPFEYGQPARLMYLGALFWLIACVAIILVWSIVVFLHAWVHGILKTYSRWRKERGQNLREKVTATKWASRLLGSRPVEKHDSHGHGIPAGEADSLIDAGQIHHPDHSSGSGSYYDRQNPVYTMRGGAAAHSSSYAGHSSSADVGSQTMHAGDFRRPKGSAARTRMDTYAPVPVEAADPEMMQIRPSDFPQSQRSASRSGMEGTYSLRTPFSAAPIEEDNMRANSPFRRPAQPDHHRFEPDYQSVPDAGDISYDGGRGEDMYAHHNRSDQTSSDDSHQRHIPRTFTEWQPWILGLGIFLGFVSYIAQWFFWAGFVKTSGDRSVQLSSQLSHALTYTYRFCPPQLASVGTLFAIANLFGTHSKPGNELALTRIRTIDIFHSLKFA